jgi:hypothetical protein
MTHTLSTGTHRNYFRTSESSDDWKTFFFFFKNLTESIFSFFFLFKIKIYYIDFLFFFTKIQLSNFVCVSVCLCGMCGNTLGVLHRLPSPSSYLERFLSHSDASVLLPRLGNITPHRFRRSSHKRARTEQIRRPFTEKNRFRF